MDHRAFSNIFAFQVKERKQLQYPGSLVSKLNLILEQRNLNLLLYRVGEGKIKVELNT
jgi:hypothetical protein